MAEMVDCPHCGKTGTCSSGENKNSCAVCASPSGLRKYPDNSKGLICSVCEGRGVVDPSSIKLPKRFVPYFSAGLVAGLISLLFASLFVSTGAGFDKIVGVCGTILGTIVGYFFGGSKK